MNIHATRLVQQMAAIGFQRLACKSQVSSFRFSHRAFTLVELLAVITIIAMLAALVVGGASYAMRKASVARCHANMETIKNALADYQIEYGGYPPGNETALYNALCKGAKVYLKDTSVVMGSRLVDPWGGNYFYQAPGTHNADGYDLWSWGPNGQNDNGGGDDLSNWAAVQ
ncbi:MAG: prepilin-type N-terminal cleavage/methylation domain-containing protein [Verrucomicrobia bacterium]|nr:MAG: prepilin-type N-terminal cleavage/methylation domain-containing protein [Verrucomicrobiota bacterium]